MTLCDCGCEGKAKACTWAFFACLDVRPPLETLENPRPVGFGYARSVIRHDEYGAITERDADCPSGGDVFEGVVEKVGQQAPELGFVTVQDNAGLHLPLQRQAGIFSAIGIEFAQTGNEGGHVDGR